MLRLLNKYKRNLLKEGKFKSFLFYTVGEVFLVVIGILIALGIDNRATIYNEEQELDEYLVKISENISSDLELAESLLNRRLSIKEICKKGLDIADSGEEISIDFMEESVKLFADFEFTPRKGGFESLVTSGYVSKLRKSKLDSLLFQYYLIVDDLRREEKSFNGFVESMEIEINRSFPLFTVYKSAMGYEVGEDHKKLLSDYFKVIPFQNAMIRGSFQNAIINRYNSLTLTGVSLKAEIDSKVNGRTN